LPINELHRVPQSPIPRHIVADRGTFAAMRAPIDRTVIVRLLADPHSIRDFANNRTSDGTMRADILAARDFCACGRRLTRVDLSNASELQHA
jgi:hypothetical protein